MMDMSILVSYKRGLRNYTIIDTWSVGILLLGPEVKSIKLKRGILEGSFIAISNNELWLRKSHISAYQEKNTPKNYNPTRDRKILMKKKEISKLVTRLNQAGMTLVPLNIHLRDNHTIGMTIALVRHANKQDKRNKIRTRDTQRELQREVKGRLKL